MESLGNNHGFLDGNKRIAFTAADVFLRRNGFYIEVDAQAGHEFILRLHGPPRISVPSHPRLAPPPCKTASLEGLCGFDHVSTTKSNSTRSVAAHPFGRLRAGPCKKRKDGAPSMGMVHAKLR
jgi:hypothetical protein